MFVNMHEKDLHCLVKKNKKEKKVFQSSFKINTLTHYLFKHAPTQAHKLLAASTLNGHQINTSDKYAQI